METEPDGAEDHGCHRSNNCSLTGNCSKNYVDPVWWFNEANSPECVLHFRDVDCHAMETVLITY